MALLVGITCGQVQAEVVLECPEVMHVSQRGLGLQAPWEAVDLAEEGRHRLTAAGLFEGVPTHRRALRPGETEGQARSKRHVQRFVWQAPSIDGIFLACHYEGTSVVSFRRIEPAPMRCDLETGRNQRGMATALIICR